MKNLLKSFFSLFVLFAFASCEQENLQLMKTGNMPLADQNIQTDTYTNQNWMSVLSDATSLSALSIPGTHDSGARYDHPLLSGTAKCQDLSILQQLQAGVRYLDIRCRHIDDAFAIHHGVVYQNINFNDVLNDCFSFLQSNPDETIVMSVKEEYDPTNNTRSFEQTFDSYVQQNPSKWYLGAGIPDLGQVRGKIVLLRRFSASLLPKGIAATAWSDNTTFEINNAQAQLKVQDQYQVPDNNSKWNAIENLLVEASTSASQSRLFLNYTSGYKPGWFGIPDIDAVSDNINPRVRNYFNSQPSGRYGVVIMDFADNTLTEPIIDTNF
ncbi:phosphatidylinositol-specific phospholipase C [Porifericola rhodea]|uniref:phosphatidylinositol-specific phospholipase C n=1 Tax=Porifericola rhodea TaxID=930972 RepID=UPI0026661FEB|nr:phosphatidylinositol-specific phospholipase C [Porifericola rhodea]WKN31416.1 phosphatidylinositol-specific phospholipase C [Porifericola rhodea]